MPRGIANLAPKEDKATTILEDSVATEPANNNPVVEESPKPVDPYAHELAQFKEFAPSLRRDMGYIENDDPRLVRNVPADMTVTWATDPRVDAGAHLSFIQGLGFRPVRVEEVTNGLSNSYKMFLRSYEVGPHDYVVVGGGVLMIGYRQYREDRRAAARAEAQARLDGNRDNLSNAGVEYVGRSKSGTMSEVQ